MRGSKNMMAAALAVAVAVVVPGVAAAAPPKVRCNMLVTEDLTLTANVYCATGTGFRLADGVTLDLNGFRLRGTEGNVGVAISSTSTVINGTVQGWSQAVWLDGDWNDPSLVKKVVVNGGTVRADNGQLQVQDSTFNGAGVEVSSAGVTVERSTFTDGSVEAFMGDATIRTSTFVRSTVYASNTGGIDVFDSSFDGQGAIYRGLGCTEADLTITRSSVSHFTKGVLADGCLGVVEDSVFLDNGTGIDANGAFNNVGLEGVTKVRRNIFESNDEGALFANSVQFTDNILTGNGIGVRTVNDWIRTIEGNTVTSSTGTGIVGGWPRETVRNNTVTAGGGQGIVAIGSIDGGGNVASGNAIVPQCEGVVCSEN